MSDKAGVGSRSNGGLGASRPKPWRRGRPANRTDPVATPTCTDLGHDEHLLLAKTFDACAELIEEDERWSRSLERLRHACTPCVGDLPDTWVVLDGGRILLDRLLLNQESRTELMRSLLYLAGLEAGVPPDASEQRAQEATRALRLPRPELRGQPIAEAIAGIRAQDADNPTLAPLDRLPGALLQALLEQLAPRLYRNHLLANDLRRRQLDLLTRLARLPDQHFDPARQTVQRLFDDDQLALDPERLASACRNLLLPEIKQRVCERLVRDLGMHRQTIEAMLPDIADVEQLRALTLGLAGQGYGVREPDELDALAGQVQSWHREIDELAEGCAGQLARLRDGQRLASAMIASHAAAMLADAEPPSEPPAQPLDAVVHALFDRLYQVSHLKRLDRPLIILLAGVPRAGGRFVARRLAQALSIRTFFTTNQVREAIRSTYHWTYGPETAGELYPELFASPLEPAAPGDGPDTLDGFYVQSLLTHDGLRGALSRLIKENSSAIIEGMHLVPGMLDPDIYGRANVINLILGYDETPEHLPAGVRDDPERMRQRSEMLARINERVVELAQVSEMTVVHDPGRFEATMGEILHRVQDTVADRGLPPEDPQLQSLCASLDMRRRGICRKAFRQGQQAQGFEEDADAPRDDATLAQLADHRAMLADADAPEPERIAAAAAIGHILARIHDTVALVFDMGGVLVRGHNAIFTRRYAAERLGVELTEEDLARIHHRVFKVDDAPYRRTTRGEAEPAEFARQLLDEILRCRPAGAGEAPDPDDPAEQQAILQAYYDHYEEIGDNTEVIARLRERGIAMYGLTNNFVDKVRSIQQRIGLIRDLPMVVSDLARSRKPHRRIFQYLVRLLQLTHGARNSDMERVLFFDDKQTNLDGAYHHFRFYGIDYDANRGERLAETPEIREILSGDQLKGTTLQVAAMSAARAENRVGAGLARALDGLGRRLKALAGNQSAATTEREPTERKVRARLDMLGLDDPAAQTPIVELARGAKARAYLERHRELLLRTRESLVALRTQHFQLLSDVVNVPDGDYDLARRELAGLIARVDEHTSPAEVERRLTEVLFGELKWSLARHLTERGIVSRHRLQRCLDDIDDVTAFKAHERDGFRELLGADAPSPAELVQIDALVSDIETGIADRARKYLHLWGRWYIDELREMVALMEDDSVREAVHRLSPHAWHAFVRWLFPRVTDIPHIKNLAKPTVVLITGTSGTGKSSVAQHIAHSLSIPIYFSTDVLAREVVRSTLDSILGAETARETLPELYGSSFAAPEDRRAAAGDEGKAVLDWYYGHSMLTMVGVRGILDRLLMTDNSAVIEGVPLVPGFLPEHYFERLNIVWVVTTVSDPETHFSRYAGRDLAGVDRGGAERYRKRFGEIRQIHDRLEMLGRRSGCTVVDNTYGLGETAELALDRIENFYAARGLPLADPERERVAADIEERRRRLWAERLLGRGSAGAK